MLLQALNLDLECNSIKKQLYNKPFGEIREAFLFIQNRESRLVGTSSKIEKFFNSTQLFFIPVAIET
ncbi:hypothetical protein Fluta_0197 [Fluviicola taffensis DSM 16823]|uniref:Uncharacterized protein n=1 Tax=Fluviicola taffensis (strain DSM 16823 / NCIMB 13979 / RW262) TaxID=755732 RepID=F2IBX8_FLUTR|nr:hypothetical protein Fluta_0197 [Fluviicola taffensis DSM 16823]